MRFIESDHLGQRSSSTFTLLGTPRKFLGHKKARKKRAFSIELHPHILRCAKVCGLVPCGLVPKSVAG